MRWSCVQLGLSLHSKRVSAMTNSLSQHRSRFHLDGGALCLLLLLLPGLWLLRMFSAAYSGAGLFVDEAQYWEWSRELAWGYYSKPPLLPVLIKLSAGIAGDGTAGIRWLVQLCWALVPLVLWRWGWEMQRDSPQTLTSSHAVGAWAAALFASSLASGVLGQATRTVDVSFTGVTVTVTGGTAATWVRVWVDGQLDPSVSISGKTVAPGTRLLFTGAKRIEIRSGDPKALLFTLNGRTISGIGSGMGAETYAFLSDGKVQKSSRR